MIIKTSVTQQVIDYIKENIAGGVWRVGEKTPSENELTRMLGISRASVRIAIRQFIALGVLNSVHGKGTFVVSTNLVGFHKSISLLSGDKFRDMRHAFEFRLAVELETACLAAEHATGENIKELDFLLEQMKSTCAEDDRENFIKYDMLFHEEIGRASDNVFLDHSLREMFNQTKEAHIHVSRYFGYKHGIYYHTLLLQAIKAKNAKKARKIMYEHLQKVIETIDAETEKSAQT
jgi:GntR family transcriptional repressor for pyruvate dehydrogenase complex